MVSLKGILPKKVNHTEAPGPGRYPINEPKSNIKYSFRKKLKQPTTSNMKSPAPGRYTIPSAITDDGRYQQSKFVNSRAPVISTSHNGRFKSFDSNMNNPAPGFYNNQIGIHDKGVYSVSKYKNSMCRSFSQANRNTLGIDVRKKSVNPGPGQYRLPSEFGHYISSTAGKDKMASQSAKNLIIGI